MKLVRLSDDGAARVGVVVGDGIVDVAAVLPQFDTMAAGMKSLVEIGLKCGGAVPAVALADAQPLAPVERPGTYLAIGMNYAKHPEEANRLGVARAKHQTWFNKQTRCVSGPATGRSRAIEGSRPMSVY